MTKIQRNDPCPCGSGKKYKKCCAATPSEPRKISVIQSGSTGSTTDKLSSFFQRRLEEESQPKETPSLKEKVTIEPPKENS